MLFVICRDNGFFGILVVIELSEEQGDVGEFDRRFAGGDGGNLSAKSTKSRS